MLKKMCWFYALFFGLAAVYDFSIGMMIGWFASYSYAARILVALLALALLFFLTDRFIKYTFRNFPLKQNDEVKFLLPYFAVTAALIVFTAFAAADALWFSGDEIFFLYFIPIGFPAMFLSSAVDLYSELAAFSLAVILSAAHTAQIGLTMRKIQRQNEALSTQAPDEGTIAEE